MAASKSVPIPSPSVQIFGTPDSQPTRAALRFFKERRIEVHLVDLRRKPMAAGELRRFVDRLGADALADKGSAAWRGAGLAYLRMDDAELAARLLADQRLLRLPLVRVGQDVAAGRDEARWKAILAGA
jgi:arsenate reductase (glutaredoxin)